MQNRRCENDVGVVVSKYKTHTYLDLELERREKGKERRGEVACLETVNQNRKMELTHACM